MRQPSALRREELLAIVTGLQQLLYLDHDERGEPFWNPDNGWSGADVCEAAAGLLAEYGLVPEEAEPFVEATSVDPRG